MLQRLNVRAMTCSNLAEYFYYFFVASLIIILVLSGTLYYAYSSILKNEIIQSNNNTLVQLKNAQELILTEVEKSIENIILDGSITNFEDIYHSRDNITIRRVYEKLDSMTYLDKYIYSIYDYYFTSGYILSSRLGYGPLKDHYDSEFLCKLDASKAVKGQVLFRDMPQSGDERSVQVLTFVKPVPLVPVSYPVSAVVANINAQFLQTTVDYINIRNGSSVLIADALGNILLRREGRNITGNLNVDEIVGRNQEESSGYWIKTVGREEVLISFITSGKYGLKYIYIVPMSAVTSKIQMVGRITFWVCLAILVISILISVLLSRRIYLPIKRIVRFLGTNSEVEEASRDQLPARETKVIENSINHLIHNNKDLTRKNMDLETILSDYHIYQKNRFLQNLVEGSYVSDERLVERLTYYGIGLTEDSAYVAFAISMDHYNNFSLDYSERQQNMLYIYINENITANILGEYKGFIVEMKANEMILLLAFDPGMDLKKISQKAHLLADAIFKTVNENVKYSFTLGVSTPHQGLSKVNECYRESVQAVNYRILLGYNNIIYYENLMLHPEYRSLYPYQIEKDILNHLKLGNREGVFKQLQEFTNYIYNNPMEETETVRHYLMQLLSAAMKTLYEIDRPFYANTLAEKNIYSALLAEETMKGMADYLSKLFEAFFEYMEMQKSDKNKELIQSVIAYICGNIAEDLSVERLAEHFYLSASHLRKIFKDETGTPIKEFIDGERMKKAKELLKNPAMKIGDIAAQIGYISVNSFTRAFKLQTGKTPGEYRSGLLCR